MTLPISGKLKDISDKKNRSSEFIFSDLEFTDEEIKINTNILLSNKEIRCERCYVIKSVDSLNSQKSYKLAIDALLEQDQLPMRRVLDAC